MGNLKYFTADYAPDTGKAIVHGDNYDYFLDTADMYHPKRLKTQNPTEWIKSKNYATRFNVPVTAQYPFVSFYRHIKKELLIFYTNEADKLLDMATEEDGAEYKKKLKDLKGYYLGELIDLQTSSIILSKNPDLIKAWDFMESETMHGVNFSSEEIFKKYLELISQIETSFPPEQSRYITQPIYDLLEHTETSAYVCKKFITETSGLLKMVSTFGTLRENLNAMTKKTEVVKYLIDVWRNEVTKSDIMITLEIRDILAEFMGVPNAEKFLNLKE